MQMTPATPSALGSGMARSSEAEDGAGRRVAAALLWLSAAAVAGPAHAHDGTGLVGGVISGLLHPVTGYDHLLAMVAVGLWGAFLGRPLVVVLPVLFPMLMAVGGVLGMWAMPMPSVEAGIALSVLVLGGLIAAAARAPAWAACSVVGIFALFHGYAHGQELPSAADPVGYSVGFVLATGILHLLGIGLGLLNATPTGRRFTRTLGAGIALAGVWFVWSALRP